MASPVPFLIAIIVANAFAFMVVGDELIEESFPTFEKPDNFLEYVVQIFDSIWGVIKVISRVILWDFTYENPVTGELEGPPFWIRGPMATVTTIVVGWSIARLIRGGG